ncbi:MAG: hypothetical protein ACR2RL_00505 [Gammaproteobacteria bacterium]
MSVEITHTALSPSLAVRTPRNAGDRLKDTTLGSAALLAAALASGCAAPTPQTGPEAEPALRETQLYEFMSDEDLRLANQAVQNALEFGISGTSSTWSNLSHSSSGAIKPLRTWRTRGGIFCRQYEEVLRIGARTDTYTDIACRSPDGLWLPAP